MADVIPFKRPVKPQRAQKPVSRGMCQHGFHKWVVWQGKQFDVKQGRLVTVYRCERCQKQKVKAH